MNSVSKYAFPCCIILGLLASKSYGALNVECIPIGGTNLTGGQSVEVKCFATTDVDQVLLAYIVDLACSLPRSPGSTGTIEMRDSWDIWVDILHVDPPWLFDPVFLTSPAFPADGPPTFSPSTCQAWGTAPLPPGIVAIRPAGEEAYLATIKYTVSDCAAGEFEIVLENFSDPPEDTDETRFSEDVGVLIPLAFTPTTLTVVTGTCCDGVTCLEDGINAFCCAQNHPGAFFHPWRSCADSYPCRCRADVFPPGGSGLTDIDDIVCGLQGFADMASCPDADLIPCGGNGIIDIDDITALLSAFAGTCPPCP